MLFAASLFMIACGLLCFFARDFLWDIAATLMPLGGAISRPSWNWWTLGLGFLTMTAGVCTLFLG